MNTSKTDSNRPEVWMALADQFLDTETRTWIPSTALLIVKAGYSIEEAKDILRYEVSPAVSFNSWSVAGEWAGWDEDWLTDRIKSQLGRWPHRPGVIPYLLYRLQVHFIHGAWTTIERCMNLFEPLNDKRRQNLDADLSFLAELYFDFGPFTPVHPTPSRRAELWSLYEDIFLPIFKPLVARFDEESPKACATRVRAVLSGPASSTG